MNPPAAPRHRRGVFPGSFNPPTVAHIAIAEAAIARHGLRRLDLAVSRVALAKEHVEVPIFEHRIEVLRAIVEEHPSLGLVVTDAQLVVEIAAGYDVVVMGADKWHQIQDVAFYGGSPHERDAAMAKLPVAAVVDRPPFSTPPALRLPVPQGVTEVSSTTARQGALHLMHPVAQRFDSRTGAWTDPDRYRLWCEQVERSEAGVTAPVSGSGTPRRRGSSRRGRAG